VTITVLLRPAVALPALLVASLVLVGGCASVRSGQEPDAPAATYIVDDFPRSRLVALDFVEAMARLPELDPARTTLHTSNPPSRFGEILVASLQQAGYDLRLDAAGTATTLGYAVREEPPGEQTEDRYYTFFVEAAGVELKRRYRVDAEGIRPASSMQRRGRGHDVAAASATSTAGARSDTGTHVSSDEADGRRSVTLSAAPAPAAVVPTPLGGTDPASALPRKRNVYETGRSNYEALLESYDTVGQDIMVFANDSLHMGRDNKRLARTIVERFDPARDVISVIGCSHGKTALTNGNEVLANGRSLRVKEEFLLAGIDADLVLEEGCWAGKHFDRMPSRGVLVTHKRRASG